MRVLIQRVSESSVTIEGVVKGSIKQGFLILVGIGEEDTEEDVSWLCGKILGMRIFSDENGLMNKDLRDVNGNILLISQFTLHAKTKKGNRPSFIKAAKPDQAIPLYQSMIKGLSDGLGKTIETGEFGADMKVALVNDGPVTIWIDSKNKE